MSATSIVVPLLVFEAADGLMDVPASEGAHLEQRAQRRRLWCANGTVRARFWRQVSAETTCSWCWIRGD